MKIELVPIGYVKNSRTEISDDFWGDVISEIELTDEYSEESLTGIEDFSHAEIIFFFDKTDNTNVHKGSRHPRGNTNWPKVGVFAQRVKDRPNQLGHTIVKIIKREGKSLKVMGLDAINGTLVIDIKPVIKEFLPSGEIKQPGWASELMKDYWKNK